MSKTKNKRRKNTRKALARRETSEMIKERRAHAKAWKLERLEEVARGVAKALKEPCGKEAQLLLMLEAAPDKEKRLLAFTAKKAPRLVEGEYLAALKLAAKLDWVRPLDDWKPKGKGRDRLFYSLMEHLLAQYPTPRIIFNILFLTNHLTPGRELFRLVGYVGKGGSLYKAVKEGLMPVPLTKRMCHELLTLPTESFVSAVRRVLVRAHDGDRQLLQAWLMTDVGESISSREDEEFWITVLRWFAANPMLDRSQLTPLIDFIAFRRRQARVEGDGAFSMKGRSPLAMLRDMNTWHGNLAKEKSIKGRVFTESGFASKTYNRRIRNQAGNFIEECWEVAEILSSKDLAREGRALGHCVYSYAWRIEDGKISIWSMSHDGDRCLTVEVRHQDRCIVQARGKHNRKPTHPEHRILLKWAGDNGLGIASNRI